MKVKQPRYHRLGTIPVRDGLAFLSVGYPLRAFNVKVGVGGLRLRTFLEKGIVCQGCGLCASHFAVERDYCSRDMPFSKSGFHLNLWGWKDENEILFTHDHTIARGLGGSDTIDNAETMCEPCNHAKSKLEQKILNARQSGNVERLEELMQRYQSYQREMIDV